MGIYKINDIGELINGNSYVGRGSGEDGDSGIGLFFEICASGNGVTYNSFTWQKQDSGGNWVSVAFDGPKSQNETYGLANETGKYTEGEFSGSSWSKVYAIGLTSAAFGKYRCLVTDSVGETKLSQEVTISNND